MYIYSIYKLRCEDVSELCVFGNSPLCPYVTPDIYSLYITARWRITFLCQSVTHG